MQLVYTQAIILSIFLFSACQNKEQESSRLWYEKPAKEWTEALPIGNGSFGAMVYGNPTREILRLNHDEFWSGYPKDGSNPDAVNHIETIKSLLDNGEYRKAHDTLRKMQGPFSQSYQPLADLSMDFDSIDVDTYYRDLNISQATAHVNYSSAKTNYTRELFSSFPDQVMAVKLKSSKKGQLNFSLAFTSKLLHKISVKNGILKLKVKAPKHVEPSYRRHLKGDQAVVYEGWNGEGMEATVLLQPVLTDGKLEVRNDSLFISNCSEVTLLVSAATSFNGRFKSPAFEGKDDEQIALGQLTNAASKTYADLKQAHIKDYQKLYNRVQLKLGDQVDSNVEATDVRLVSYQKNQDPNLVTLLFNYGRYLLISSSRPGTQTANLQGMWSQKVQPPWSCNYTQNINVEMNYWPAEPCNLPELTEPFLSLIKDNSITGQKIASTNYGLPGWTTHHNGDIWAHSAPVGDFGTGDPKWAFWSMGGAWFCNHVFEHYLFNGDKEFLQEFYPVLKGASQFVRGMLYQNEEGYYETIFGTSPENAFTDPASGKSAAVCPGPAGDLAMTNELLNNCLKAAQILDIDTAFQNELMELIPQLQPFRINAKERIMEWNKDFEEQEPEHRHLTHLYGLHPSNQINAWDTPELFEAAKNSMLGRGDGATGWSMGWKSNIWARLLDGNHALKIINNLFTPVGFDSIKTQGGGLYLNLFDAHPPFQIDGNFGVTAGISEILVQSHAGAVHLLPALPNAWDRGSVKGLKTRGGFILNIKWENGELLKASIHSTLGGTCRIRSALPLSIPNAKDAQEGPCNNPLLSSTFIPKPQWVDSNTMTLPESKNWFTYDVSTSAGEIIEITKK